MDFWRSIDGMVSAELTDAEIERTLTVLNSKGIILYQLESAGSLTAKMRLKRRDFPLAKKLAEKCGGNLKMTGAIGLYWKLGRLLQRPVLVSGLLLFLLLSMLLPTRILFIRVDGNSIIPARRILAEAEQCGISFFASRRAVRSEGVKNALLERLPQLQWAGVNTAGCVATISVQERPMEDTAPQDRTVSAITADRDGYILSVTVTAGNALIQPGETVREGQVLISGYTDCGLTVRAERAEGEILAQTSRALETVTPRAAVQRGEIRSTQQSFGIIFGKKRINLWKDSGIYDTTCGRMYEEYPVRLPGGFTLPIRLWRERQIEYSGQSCERQEEQCRAELSQFSRDYLLNQMVCGEILHTEVKFSAEADLYKMNIRCLCKEMLGRRQQERIGAIHGEDSGADR